MSRRLVLQTLASLLRLRVVVETCESTVGALERIRATDHAALVCDANQPRLPGLSFVRAVRKFRPETPILLMLEQRDRDAGRQLRGAGAYDLLIKPIEEETFLLAVSRAIAKAKPEGRFKVNAPTSASAEKGEVGRGS